MEPSIARDVDALLDCGAYGDDSPGVMGYSLFMATGPYRIANFRARGRLVSYQQDSLWERSAVSATRRFHSRQKYRLMRSPHTFKIDPFDYAPYERRAGRRSMGGWWPDQF